jgi:transcriptional adapter 2-alpha
MEKRKDFEMEHDNDIELFLADLDFFDDDTSEDRDIKFKQLEVYNSVLDEREERKAFAIDRWELEIQNERKYSRNIVDKNVYTALKPIARFLPPEKFSSIVDNMIRE